MCTLFQPSMSTDDHPDLVMLFKTQEDALQVLAAEFYIRNLLVILEIKEIFTLKSIK